MATSDTPTGGLDTDPAARGTIYALLASAARHPTEAFHETIADGDLETEMDALLDRTVLGIDPPRFEAIGTYEDLAARYNDVFVIGYSEYENPMDGTLNTTEPPVPLYESAYRTDVSWNDVNLDLARAYDYYDLGVNESERDHHDHLSLQLEFAGYLARREATVDGVDAAAARLDFLDRHLSVLVEGVHERIVSEPETGCYGPLLAFLHTFVDAERDEIAARPEVDR